MIEYGNIIWGPQYKRNIEKVQRRATKSVHELFTMSYPDRLAAVNLPSLYYRRLRGDMIYLYQLMHGHLGINFSELFTMPPTFNTRGHKFKIFKPTAITRPRVNFFSVRTIDHWNHLPDSVVNAPTINVF